MAYRFSKAEAYSRTNKIVVEIPDTFESQFLFNHLNKIGSYEGQNYWNCFDVYEVGNVRFLYGNFPRESKDFSSKLLKEIGLKARDIWNNSFHNDIYISDETRVNEIQKLAEDFATSIEKGIHDPGPIKSFVSYKKELLEQHKMFPDKPLLEIASELTKCIVNDEAKQKVNIGISKAIKNVNLDSVDKLDITDMDKVVMNKALENIVQKAEINIKKENQQTREI